MVKKFFFNTFLISVFIPLSNFIFSVADLKESEEVVLSSVLGRSESDLPQKKKEMTLREDF